jgi:hypothetical protein
VKVVRIWPCGTNDKRNDSFRFNVHNAFLVLHSAFYTNESLVHDDHRIGAKNIGITIALAWPVSSSRIKMRPRAVPGRWRVITAPTAMTELLSGSFFSSLAETMPICRNCLRRYEIGCGPDG